MRQFATQTAFSEPPGDFALTADPNSFELNNLLLLAIERALAPPIIHRRSMFQPMRVIVVEPGVATRDESIGYEMPRLLPRAFQNGEFSNQTLRTCQRAVRGEILSDESGRLYEKLGRQIRPIHQLASGPYGEVIDLVPLRQSLARTTPQSTPSNEPTNTSVNGGSRSLTGDSENPRFVPLQPQSEQANQVNCRKLFADPGQWRVVWWGEFKEILGPQLAHPERLRDTYRLPCYAQVIETERTVAIEELAALYKSDKEVRLYFLTDEIATKLDLVLPLRPAPPPSGLREPNTLLPHERVFRLIVANDPTIDITTKSKQQASASTVEVTAKDAVPAALLKDTIPARFVKEWEFKINREEAMYDMNSKPSWASWILKPWRRFRTAEQLRKWQTLIRGKDPDEQLWTVRPPTEMLGDSSMRKWAAQTLELGGYDSRKMISEWEIFWRRKGL